MTHLPLPIRSMRLWLQSSALLAVLAGFSSLLLFDQRLAIFQRDQRHAELVDRVLNQLRNRPLSATGLEQLNAGLLISGVRISLKERPTPSASQHPAHEGIPSRRPPHISEELHDTWLSSEADVQLLDGRQRRIQIEQDVTASVQQQWMAFWLLVAGAGVSCLFTSALLRLVLKRGLTQPLSSFSEQISTFQGPPRSEDRINLAMHPVEIQPIGAAFNALQDRLQHAWEHQRTFMEGVAHELRTPITLISGRSQSLMRQADNPQISTILDQIQREADQMGHLVSDLLDLARRDTGYLNLRTTAVVAEDALLQAYERLEPRADGRLRIELSDETAALTCLADHQRLLQCLTVLVDNALLYSPSYEMVTLCCSEQEAGGLVMHVLDRGPGVAEDERETIFDRFVRGSAGLKSEKRGSGVGLALVKLLMEAMLGTVMVSKRPGGGSDFQLHLPALSALDQPASE